MSKEAAIIIIPFIILLQSCKSHETQNPINQDINKGNITIYCTNEYAVIMNELVKSYENVYDSAHINIIYTNEADAINKLLNNTAQIIVVGRNLYAGELEKGEIAQGLKPKENIFAYEALAIVVNKSSSDTVFDLNKFIASERDHIQNEYAKKTFIFDNANSGTLAYLLTKTELNNIQADNMFAEDSLPAFVDYLKKNDESIGIISFAKLSDKDDLQMKKILEDIKILPVAVADSSGKNIVIALTQSSIATGEYPLIRPINIIVGNIADRIGTGFVNFLYKSKSERIFLKAGLMPYEIPERQLLIKEEN